MLNKVRKKIFAAAALFSFIFLGTPIYIRAAAAQSASVQAPAYKDVSADTSGAESDGKKKIWNYQCIDTMKDSRDEARAWMKLPNPGALVDADTKAVKALGADCVAIGTPYDEEFFPFLKLWVDSARLAGLAVWFRGNFSGWEGWFGYQKLQDATEHHQKTKWFILNHRDIFRAGDVFTPATEPENGIIGNLWSSEQRKKNFLDFLVESHRTCASAVEQIKINLKCGYYAVNGDVALKVFTPDVVKKTGNIVVIDHYVRSPKKFIEDVRTLYKKFGTKIFIGEFGAPIPDIHGSMSQEQQAEFVGEMLRYAHLNREIIDGLNYWVLRGGSTSILNDSGTQRLVAAKLKDYYDPVWVSGRVTNTLGQDLPGQEITSDNWFFRVSTSSNGRYLIVLPPGAYNLTVGGRGYAQQSKRIKISSGSKRVPEADFVLEPAKFNLFYKIRLVLKRFFKK